jgi:hypothetical protein
MGEMWAAAATLDGPLVSQGARELVIDWLDFVTLSTGYLDTSMALDEVRHGLGLSEAVPDSGGRPPS